jgi:hypothetical protein
VAEKLWVQPNLEEVSPLMQVVNFMVIDDFLPWE